MTAEKRDSAFPAALGKYVPFARLGSGGMAEIFLSVARGPVGFNKLTVVKRLRNPDDPTHVEMFLDEARLAARLNHPNVVHTYEVGQAGGKYFIAMEYLEGQSLNALLARLRDKGANKADALGDPLVAYVAAQALRGLHHAHDLCDFDGTALGIVHRDVSPHNLYLTYSGEVKLLDFGIAKAAMNASHTETGVLKGKIRYMAPEQIADWNIDRRADLFAFGVVLWELLARRPLFQGDAAAVLGRIVNHDVEPVRSVRPDVSPALDRIAMKALRRDPDERYATADAMRADIDDYLRTVGEQGLEKELAGIMNDVFAKTRDEVRARIRAFLEHMPADDGNEGSSPQIGRTRDLPTLVDASGSHTPPATSGIAPIQTRKHGWFWLLAAAAVSVAGVVVLARLGRTIQPAAAAPATVTDTGHVRLTTTPPGALVERDGKPLSHTPAAFDLDPGTVTLRVSMPGYEAETLSIDVAAGSAIDRTLALRATAPPAPAPAPPTIAPPVSPASPAPRPTARAPVAQAPAAQAPLAAQATAPKPAASGHPHLNIRVLDE